MKKTSTILIMLTILFTTFNCQKNDHQKNLLKFNEEFFKTHVPELPEVRLLQKSDLPEHQQQFFSESGGQLQLLADLNNNSIPEYIVTGVSEECLRNKIKRPYFIAIFERQESGITRLFFQQVYVPPVNINLSNINSSPRVVISFAFYSGYGAEIYFQNGEYHLERW